MGGGEVNQTFVLPLRVKASKRKWFVLNLNQYRNTHYQTLNNVKRRFHDIFKGRYGYNDSKPISHVHLKYTIYFKDRRKVDVGNVGSIVDKFASDCLVHFGYLEDDNREIVKKVTYEDGGVDKYDPRAELEIIEIRGM